MPPVTWTTSVTMARSDSTCRIACSRCSFQTETRKRKNSESTNHSTITVRKGASGNGLGVRRMTASSMASRTIRIRMRTFTSQVSQFRSSEMECMNFVVVFVRREEFAVGYELRATMTNGLLIAHSPKLVALGLSRQFSDPREQRHVQRNNDAADADAEQTDNDRLQHGQHVFGGRVDFVFVEVCDLLQHGIHGAGGFAHANHLRHHVGKDAAFAERIDNRAAFFDRLANSHQRFFQHLVARSASGNGQAFENWNA